MNDDDDDDDDVCNGYDSRVRMEDRFHNIIRTIISMISMMGI
jgi:hypothetical protein